MRNNKASIYDMSLYQSPFYKSWVNMKTRCNNPKYHLRKDYGGRGISVCDKWLKFSGFMEDMLTTYFEGAQIDRIDNNGNYEPSNCRWVTPKQNSRNRRNSRFIEINGQSKTIAEWAEISGVKSSTFRQRFYGLKWPIEDCFKPNMRP